MNKFVILAVVGGLGIWVAGGMGKAYRLSDELERSLDSYLAPAAKSPVESVKAQLIKDAQVIGVTLTADNISISVTPTQQLLPAQQHMAGQATFDNREVRILVRYTARAAAFKLKMLAQASGIQQVGMTSREAGGARAHSADRVDGL